MTEHSVKRKLSETTESSTAELPMSTPTGKPPATFKPSAPPIILPPLNMANGPYETVEKTATTSVATTTASNHLPRNEDLVSAAEALTQLTRSITPPAINQNITQSRPLPVRNGSNTPTLSSVASPVSALTLEDAPAQQHPLVTQVSRVSKHPIVTNAVKYYESQKRNYGAFNYAAGIVEKAAIPMVNRIELNLNNRHQAKQLKKQHKRRRISKKKRKVSLETKRRLQFCVHILKLANDHINNKVSVLQQVMIDKENEKRLKLQQDEPPAYSEVEERQPERHSSETIIGESDKESESEPNTQQTKTEIIATVKKIIHVISNFKPSSLNGISADDSDEDTLSLALTDGEDDDMMIDSDSSRRSLELKTTIRDIILRLPATIQQSAAPSTSSASTNDRIFVLAKESLDMIAKLTGVFNEQLEKAEQWVAKKSDDEMSSVSPPSSNTPEPNSLEKTSADVETTHVDISRTPSS